MNKQYRLCIVGYGFVGKAIAASIKYQYHDSHNLVSGEPNPYFLTIVDPALDNPIENIKGQKFDAIFIAVPTPSSSDGTIDSSIVTSVLNYINKNVQTEIVVLKSTITPDLVKFYCQNPKVLYNPEFLTEKHAKQDFADSTFHIIGSNSRSSAQFLEMIYREAFSFNSLAKYVYVTPEQASFIKYGINCFLASKVAWFNEFYDILTYFGGNHDDYSKIIDAMQIDPRIGYSHMNVPGWDGKRGFGGACFAKDLPAFIHFSKNMMLEPEILKKCWNYNVLLRTQGELLDREVAQNIQYKAIF